MAEDPIESGPDLVHLAGDLIELGPDLIYFTADPIELGADLVELADDPMLTRPHSIHLQGNPIWSPAWATRWGATCTHVAPIDGRYHTLYRRHLPSGRHPGCASMRGACPDGFSGILPAGHRTRYL